MSGYDHDEEANGPEIEVPYEWSAGAYANTTTVFFTPEDFTIDFARVAPNSNPGVVVARIALSPRAANDLAAQLDEQLQAWAARLLFDPEGDDDG